MLFEWWKDRQEKKNEEHLARMQKLQKICDKESEENKQKFERATDKMLSSPCAIRSCKGNCFPECVHFDPGFQNRKSHIDYSPIFKDWIAWGDDYQHPRCKLWGLSSKD